MMTREIGVGDQVAITATVVKRISDDRVSINIPSYGFPYSIFAPKAKPRQKLELTGEVTRVDDDSGKVTVQIGSLVTVDADQVTLLRKYQAPLRDKAD